MQHNTCNAGCKKETAAYHAVSFLFPVCTRYAPETIKAIIPKPLAHRQSQHNNTLLSVSYLPVRSSLP